MADAPTGELARRVRDAIGALPVAWRPVARGWTAAARWIAVTEDGSSVFVKAATEDATARWLRAEHGVYAAVSAPFMPRFLGWHDDGACPVLVLEDLSSAEWPPPWSEAKVGRVLETLDEIHATRAPAALPALEEQRDELQGWSSVANDPGLFLTLELCSPQWLDDALGELIAASERAVLEGDELLHLDVRSDNICFAHGRTVLIDWNSSSVGNGVVDTAFWLPSLEREGGPAPEDVADVAPELVAFLSGYFASRAGLPPPFRGSRVREVQLDQLRSALPWAARTLSLPPPRSGLR